MLIINTLSLEYDFGVQPLGFEDCTSLKLQMSKDSHKLEKRLDVMFMFKMSKTL
jgi:hypothetical protein